MTLRSVRAYSNIASETCCRESRSAKKRCSGFRINGAAHGRDRVAIAGDVNADGFDDILVALRASGNVKAHLIFGGPGVGATGEFDLSTLDGSNGARIAAEQNLVVSDLGDFNGDGIDDILVGNRKATDEIAWIVFGDPHVGGSGVIDLSTLNGLDGVSIVNSDFTTPEGGRMISGAGDVNGDGLDDFLTSVRRENTHALHGFETQLLVVHGRDTASQGAGDLHDLFELRPGAATEYVIAGRARSTTTDFTVSVEAERCALEEESTPDNNSASVTFLIDKIALAGDANLDGRVSFVDFLIVSANIGQNANVTRSDGDLDGDGAVTFTDFLQVSENFGNGT